MKIITLKVVLSYLKCYQIRLITFTAIGFIVGVIYTLVAPKIYEAYIDIALPQVSLISNGKFVPNSLLVTPSVDELRKSYLNPLNISTSLLEACSFPVASNENRKTLVDQINSQSADPQNSRIAVRVRLAGKDAIILCAKKLEDEIIYKSNLQKNSYLSNGPNDPGVLNIAATSRGAIVISDSYITPRPLHVVLGATIFGFLLSVFLTWFLGQWKKNTL